MIPVPEMVVGGGLVGTVEGGGIMWSSGEGGLEVILISPGWFLDFVRLRGGEWVLGSYKIKSPSMRGGGS